METPLRAQATQTPPESCFLPTPLGPCTETVGPAGGSQKRTEGLEKQVDPKNGQLLCSLLFLGGALNCSSSSFFFLTLTRRKRMAPGAGKDVAVGWVSTRIWQMGHGEGSRAWCGRAVARFPKDLEAGPSHLCLL